jgi:hypothetical protein
MPHTVYAASAPAPHPGSCASLRLPTPARTPQLAAEGCKGLSILTVTIRLPVLAARGQSRHRPRWKFERPGAPAAAIALPLPGARQTGASMLLLRVSPTRVSTGIFIFVLASLLLLLDSARCLLGSVNHRPLLCRKPLHHADLISYLSATFSTS